MSRRVLGSLLATMVLLLPAGQATAADDPGPVEWPKVEQPGAGGNQSGPVPAEWPVVEPPKSQGTGNDPQPVEWPAPQQN